MANERTFLAWIRTSIGIMAFGFIIEKLFAFSGFTGTGHSNGMGDNHNSYALMGISLVFLGAAAGFLAGYRYLKTEREIMEDTYRPSLVPDILVAILLGSIGSLMVIYLIKTL